MTKQKVFKENHIMLSGSLIPTTMLSLSSHLVEVPHVFLEPFLLLVCELNHEHSKKQNIILSLLIVVENEAVSKLSATSI